MIGFNLQNANGKPLSEPELTLSGKLWPVHFKPKEDELLSSWLVRLAKGHGLKLHTFCSIIWPQKQIWNRDIDKSADLMLLHKLSSQTSTDLERVKATTLFTYQGILYEKHNPHGNTPWIMPLGIYHRLHRNFGLQFCSGCLADAPYFRKQWRLAFITVCQTHQTLLLDRCPKCQSAINFHRHELGKKKSLPVTSITACYNCQQDLREIAAQPIDSFDLSFQTKLISAINQGWFSLTPELSIYPILFFPLLRQLMKLLCAKKGTKFRFDLWQIVAHTSNYLPIPAAFQREIEHLNTFSRFVILKMVAWLLENWPNRFIEWCKQNGILSSVLFKDLDNISYWYWVVVHEHLYRPAYYPSQQEVVAAAKYLQNSQEGKVSKKALVACFGNRDIFRKRPELEVILEISHNSASKVTLENK